MTQNHQAYFNIWGSCSEPFRKNAAAKPSAGGTEGCLTPGKKKNFYKMS